MRGRRIYGLRGLGFTGFGALGCGFERSTRPWPPRYGRVVGMLTMFALSFLMVNVGHEFVIERLGSSKRSLEAKD